MSTTWGKKENPTVSIKDARRAKVFVADVARTQKTGYKFAVIDSKEFEKEAKSLLV